MGRRPVVLLSRDGAYLYRELVTIAPVTTRVRGISSEVPLGPEDGLTQPCAANLDTIQTVQKNRLARLLTRLSPKKLVEVEKALKYALDLPE
jgi:mRNA interferase MazF